MTKVMRDALGEDDDAQQNSMDEENRSIQDEESLESIADTSIDKDDDEVNEGVKMDGSKPICYIGILTNDNCLEQATRGKRRLGTDTFANLYEDVTAHLLTIPNMTLESITSCLNCNEQWLIQNRLGSKIEDSHLICGKHRSKYGIGYTCYSCKYPGHDSNRKSGNEKGEQKGEQKGKQKGKQKENLRIIPMTQLKAIHILNSSLLHQTSLPIGSKWCTNCRSKLHPTAMEKFVDQETICSICYEEHHGDEVATNDPPVKRPRMSVSSVNILGHEDSNEATTSRHTPPQSPQLLDQYGTPSSQVSISSQEEYTPEEVQRETFNETMAMVDKTWTPLRNQLRTPFFQLSKKGRENLLRKADKAVDTVLEEIAPGQGSLLKKELLKQNRVIDFNKELKKSIENAVGNVKIQLLSLVAGRDEDGHYHHTTEELLQIFPSATKHYIEMARKHAGKGATGMPIVPAVYTRKKLKDYQIDHFLDFMQFSNLIQDVASGTRTVTLSTQKKATMPNVVRTVHKAEIIRLYETYCEREGYTDKPSTRTLWNILSMCPASQRKHLAGLDNVAAEGADSFDVLINIMSKIVATQPEKKEEILELETLLLKGKRYLKGEYKSNCQNIFSKVADHCRAFALSDPKCKEYQKECQHKHTVKCDDCESLKSVLSALQHLDLSAFDSKDRGIMEYDIGLACTRIEAWKAHILTVIHQDTHKYEIMRSLDEKTAFVIIDFAMKFLSRRYRESMAKWFGKSGNGMHVSCVIYKVAGKFRKRTYISFIGKSSQDVGAVMAIYESCLEQIKIDLPQITNIIDKSDNAGCYHTETLFTWKALWPPSNTGHHFLDTMFNERQAGKDQCDRDSATAKRQMNYHVSSGHNIETPEEMNEALRTATAICGFLSSVLQIDKGEWENPKNIKKIARIHHVKYPKDGKKFRVWQYFGIGKGKEFKVGPLPTTPEYKVVIPFQQGHNSHGTVMAAKKKKTNVFCTEPMCKKSFDSVDAMLHHVDYEEHDFVISRHVTQLAGVADKWVARFTVDSCASEISDRHDEDGPESSTVSELGMGWAIPKRSNRKFTPLQQNFFNKLFDQGETTGVKVTGERAPELMRDQLDPKHFVPLTSIKSYFHRRLKAIKDGKSKIGEWIPEPVTNEPSVGHEEEIEEEDEAADHDLDLQDDVENAAELQQEREKLTSQILLQTEGIPDLIPDDWIAVDMGSSWLPGQFIKYDPQQEEAEVNLLQRSPSNPKWFVWPIFEVKGEEHRVSLPEDAIFFVLDQPSVGRRETLLFSNYEEVEAAFKKHLNLKYGRKF